VRLRLYVYALVPAGTAVADLGTGIVDEPLHVASVGALDAVYGEVEDRPSIAPGSLAAHDAIVRRIGAAAGRSLPLPFGAMVDDAAELRDGLAPRAAALVAALDLTRDCEQMTLVVEAEGAARLRPRLRDALGGAVRAEKLDARPSGPDRMTLFHLVARPDVPAYRAAVASLAGSLAPARLAVTGPWVPYAFTELG
jgi:Gas vesicle synthesis protein GvpL/GvpF